MTGNGTARVTITEEAIKERVTEYLAQAWEEGFHEGRATVSHKIPCDGRLWYEEDWTNPYRAD